MTIRALLRPPLPSLIKRDTSAAPRIHCTSPPAIPPLRPDPR